MQEEKNTQRASVRIGYDGRVHKIFRGPNAVARYENEVKVLEYLESRDCPFVPRVISRNANSLEVVMTNCGTRVTQISPEKVQALFEELQEYGVKHDDPFDRNITYRATDGRFCIIDFEFATILEEGYGGLTQADSLAMSVSDPATRQHKPETLTWSAKSHRGRFRSNNEDYYLAAKIHNGGLKFLGIEGFDLIENNEWIFAVSDGMGGERSGELASKITTQRASSHLPGYFGNGITPQRTLSPAILKSMVEDIHADLLKLGKADRDLQNMGATLTLIWLRGSIAFYAHVGDSRLYHASSDQKLRQLTQDHSHAGYLLRDKQINEREFRTHPRRSVLNQCLGAGHQFLKPQTGHVEVQSGDKLLLCTDGVVDGHFDRGLQEMLYEPPGAWAVKTPADRLVMSAVEASGRDNASAVVVEFA